MNMIERVAMAIYETDDRSGHWAEWDELDHENPTRLYSFKRAEIILDELMKPTEGMLKAGSMRTGEAYTDMIKAAKDGK